VISLASLRPLCREEGCTYPAWDQPCELVSFHQLKIEFARSIVTQVIKKLLPVFVNTFFFMRQMKGKWIHTRNNSHFQVRFYCIHPKYNQLSCTWCCLQQTRNFIKRNQVELCFLFHVEHACIYWTSVQGIEQENLWVGGERSMPGSIDIPIA